MQFLSELSVTLDNVAWCRIDISTPAGANVMFVSVPCLMQPSALMLTPTLLQGL